MKELNILNVYQMNLLKHLLFMFKVKNSIIPRAFNQVFSLTDHLYSTRFPDNSLKVCDFNWKLTRFVMGFRGPTTWNKFRTEREKIILAVLYLKTRSKKKF